MCVLLTHMRRSSALSTHAHRTCQLSRTLPGAVGARNRNPSRPWQLMSTSLGGGAWACIAGRPSTLSPAAAAPSLPSCGSAGSLLGAGAASSCCCNISVAAACCCALAGAGRRNWRHWRSSQRRRAPCGQGPQQQLGVAVVAVANPPCTGCRCAPPIAELVESANHGCGVRRGRALCAQRGAVRTHRGLARCDQGR